MPSSRLSRLSSAVRDEEVAVTLPLHPTQTTALTTPATEILYGGAAGGGKSHLLRTAAITWCGEIPGLQAYLFRRIEGDLIKNHVEGPTGFRATLAPLIQLGYVNIVEGEIRFWNGSKIYLCHCKDDAHRFKYQGTEMHVLLVDELTHFSEVVYRFLRSRVRMTGIELPAKYQGQFPRILCASNPGNQGHHFVKSMWIDGAEPYQIRQMADDGGMLRQFIPAKLSDNPSLLKSDPLYRERLRGMGSPQLVKAMEEGDWNVVEGAFFSEWNTARHVVKPFAIPRHWLRFRSIDWGSAAPFSVLWWAVASEDIVASGATIPRGALIAYREWYGASAPNVGLKMTAEEVARGILQRQPSDEEITYTAADPSMFKADGGPSNAEVFARNGVHLMPADNSRVAGWDQLRSRLKGDGDGRPMIFFFSTCADSIRTIPALQHDTHRPEDVDTDSEDHAGDSTRYACMSRMWVKAAPAPEVKEIKVKPLTFADMERRIPRARKRV